MTIWLDMDGTIANLYGVPNWLNMLEAHDATPYAEATPLVKMATLARLLNARQRDGYRIAIISALSKHSNDEYDKKVMAAKIRWLAKHLPTVDWNEILFVPYTCDKNVVNTGNDILIDDEVRHLENWTGTAIPAANLLEALKALR